DETKAVFVKLSKFIGDSLTALLNRADQQYCLRLHRCRVYYAPEPTMKRAANVQRKQLLSFGTCLGKFTKSNKFHLQVTALDFLAPYAKHKIWLKPSAEQQFLYGHHVTKAGLGRITDATPQYAGLVVYSMSDTPLGFGVAAKSTLQSRKADPMALVCFHQADIGEYIRSEATFYEISSTFTNLTLVFSVFVCQTMSKDRKESAEQVMKETLLAEIQANQADAIEAENILTKKLSILSLAVNSLNRQTFNGLNPMASICDAEMVNIIDSAESRDHDAAATLLAQSLTLGSLLFTQSEPVTVECLSLRQFIFHQYWLVCANVSFTGQNSGTNQHNGQLLASLQLLPLASSSAEASSYLWHSYEISISGSELSASGCCRRLIAWCQRTSGTDCCCQATVELRFNNLESDRFHRQLGALQLNAGTLLNCDWQTVLLQEAADIAHNSAVWQLADCVDQLQSAQRYSFSPERQQQSRLSIASIRAQLFNDINSKNQQQQQPRKRVLQLHRVTIDNTDWIVAPATVAGCRLVWTGVNESEEFVCELRFLLQEQSSLMTQLLAGTGLLPQPVDAANSI
uniref:60S ribosome subunit biogenesis protein NIP7 homolog n=1 Tax=Macrostomum lignano TaxID=282301 RepID=A0A1I8J1F8_9PLAT